MNLASISSTCLALGPGSCISSRGNFVSRNFVSVVAIILPPSRMVGGCSGWVTARRRRTNATARTRIALTHVPAVRGRLNLRRRGLAVGRPGRKFCGARGYSCDSFAFPTDASVPTIFKNYTTFREFLADAVGRSEVPALASGIAFGDEFFDLGVAQRVGVLAVSQLDELGGVIVFEDCEDAIEVGEELFGGGDVVLAEFAFVDRDVSFTHEIVSSGKSLRGVEIIGQAGVKIFHGFGDALGHPGMPSRSEFSLRQSVGEITEPLDGAGRLLQAIER